MLKILVNQPHNLLSNSKSDLLSLFERGLVLHILLLHIAVGFFLLSCHFLHSNYEICDRGILRELLTLYFTLVCLFRRFFTTRRFISKEESCVLKCMTTSQKLALLGKNDFEQFLSVLIFRHGKIKFGNHW